MMWVFRIEGAKDIRPFLKRALPDSGDALYLMIWRSFQSSPSSPAGSENAELVELNEAGHIFFMRSQ